LRAIQRLDLGFFINTQDQSLIRRIQVSPTNRAPCR
jgi:hypothetical protein